MIPTPSGRSRSGLRRYRLATVLEEIMGTPDKAIPNSVLAKAEGIAVFPPTVKGGFIFGAHRGQTRGQILVTSVLEGDGALRRLSNRRACAPWMGRFPPQFDRFRLAATPLR